MRISTEKGSRIHNGPFVGKQKGGEGPGESVLSLCQREPVASGCQLAGLIAHNQAGPSEEGLNTLPLYKGIGWQHACSPNCREGTFSESGLPEMPILGN